MTKTMDMPGTVCSTFCWSPVLQQRGSFVLHAPPPSSQKQCYPMDFLLIGTVVATVEGNSNSGTSVGYNFNSHFRMDLCSQQLFNSTRIYYGLEMKLIATWICQALETINCSHVSPRVGATVWVCNTLSVTKFAGFCLSLTQQFLPRGVCQNRWRSLY